MDNEKWPLATETLPYAPPPLTPQIPVYISAFITADINKSNKNENTLFTQLNWRVDVNQFTGGDQSKTARDDTGQKNCRAKV